MKNVPEILWLQIGEKEEVEDVDDFDELDMDSVTWCQNEIFPDSDIKYVRSDIAEAAVLAERRRVWDVLTSEMIARDTIDDIDNEYRYMRKLIFPNGEPTAEDSSADQTNPPAGERRDSEG